jgi:hypothetical protein
MVLEVSEISLLSSLSRFATMLPASLELAFGRVAACEELADPVDAATDSGCAGWIAGNRKNLARPSSPPALQAPRVQVPRVIQSCFLFF